MSHLQPEKTTFINPLPVKDLLVSGKELGLPMVDFIAANHRYSAGRMSWHSHDGHEIVLLLSGSTGYEFRGGRFRFFATRGFRRRCGGRVAGRRGSRDCHALSCRCIPCSQRSQARGHTGQACGLMKHLEFMSKSSSRSLS